MAAARKINIEVWCNECERKFKRVIGRTTIEVRCPKCRSFDTEPMVSGFLKFGPLRPDRMATSLLTGAKLADAIGLSKERYDQIRNRVQSNRK